MPARKRLSDEQINELMEEFYTRRVRVQVFCADKGLAVPTFRRWKREWDEKRSAQRLAERLANLPEKLLAWMPPCELRGRERNASTQDPLLALIADLADNLGPHTEDRVSISVCTGGLVVSGKVIGGQEYFDQVREFVLRGAAELPEKYRKEADECVDKMLPDAERLPERREDWDEFYAPDEYRDAPEFIHLSDVTIHSAGQPTYAKVWRGRLSSITSFWTE